MKYAAPVSKVQLNKKMVTLLDGGSRVV